MPTSTGTYDQATLTYNQSNLSFDGFDVPLANMPAVGVFIAWTDGPYVAAPAWTEISQYVRGVTIRRGRSDDLQQFPPGAAQVVLDNRLRYFDPFNTSAPAPFNGNLKPRKQIKIVANWSGVEYPLFRGFVAGWPVEYTDGGLDSTVTIDCFDIMGLMGREVSATSYCEQYTLNLNPTVFIRCAQLGAYTDQTISTYTRRNFAVDVVRNTSIYPNFIVSVLINDTTLAAQVGSVAVVNGSAQGILTQALEIGANAGIMASPGVPSATPQTGDLSWSAFLSFDSKGNSFVQPVNVNASLGYSMTLYSPTNASVAGAIEVQFYNLAGTGFLLTTNKRMVDAAVHHYCVTVNTATKTISFYLDGELTGSRTYTGDLATKNFTQFGGGSIGANSSLTFQHWALFENRCLTADEVASIYRFGINFYNESAAGRARFYIDQTSLQAGQYNIDPDMASRVGEYQLGAQPILPELKRLTSGDDGEMFVDAAGVLQLVDGNYYFNTSTSNTSQVTFTDTGAGVRYDASDVRIAFDADQVRNTVVVTGSRDFQALSNSADSVADNGEAAENIDTRLASTPDCQTLSDRVLTIYKNPKMAVEPFMSKGQQDPAYNWPRLLGLELLDRVTFKRTPATGSAVVKDLLVQSIEHRFTPGTWETVVNGSARYTNWFIVGVSLIGGDDLLLN